MHCEYKVKFLHRFLPLILTRSHGQAHVIFPYISCTHPMKNDWEYNLNTIISILCVCVCVGACDALFPRSVPIRESSSRGARAAHGVDDERPLHDQGPQVSPADLPSLHGGLGDDRLAAVAEHPSPDTAARGGHVAGSAGGGRVGSR